MRKNYFIRIRHRSGKARILLSLMLLLISLYYSCRKEPSQQAINTVDYSVKFFSYDASLDSGMKIFIQEIKRQDSKFHFLNFFVENNGYPNWKNYQKTGAMDKMIAIIPFSLEQQKETNGFIICKKNGNSFSFALYKKDSLFTYGYKDRSNRFNAQQVQTVLNNFNYKYFGITTYRINDRRMLPDSILKNYPGYTNPAQLLGHLKVKTNNRNSETFKAYNCITYAEETEWWYNPDGDACDCNGDEYYVYSTYTYNTTCVESAGGTGTTTYGNTQVEESWWIGSGGSGGGGSSPDTTHAVVRDSTYFKGLLNKYALGISKLSDSAFKVAQAKKWEYSYIIVGKSDSIYARNMKTDSTADSVSTNYTILSREILKGDGHTHQDDNSSLPANRCSVDMDDVYALSANGNSSKQDFVTMVEAGDMRQALVVEDPVKAAKFVHDLGLFDYFKPWKIKANSGFTGSNWRQATLTATLTQLGSSATSGIGVYQTVDTNKTQFKKLN